MKPVDHNTRKLDKRVSQRGYAFVITDVVSAIIYIAAVVIVVKLVAMAGTWVWSLF